MKRTANLILALLAAIIMPLSAGASSAAARYNHGNELYKAGEYAKAAEEYNKAIEEGGANAMAYYNLGNARLKSGDLGRAVMAYLKAKELAPRDPDIEYNLDYARGLVKTQLPPLERGPFSKAFFWVLNLFSANGWTAIAAVIYWAAAAAGVWFAVSRGRGGKEAAKPVLYTLLALSAMALVFTAVRVKLDVLTPRAVILADKVSALSGPGDNNKVLFETSEGVEVVVGQCDQGWCEVSAAGGFRGWVKADSFERL